MVSRRTDKLLQSITHHTNLEQPYNTNISGEKYPGQDSNVLGRTVTLRYKNRYIPDVNHINDTSPDRYEPGPGEYDEDLNFIEDIYEDEFIILRCDLTPPFKALFLSTDYKVMLVGDSRTYTDENIVFKYPKQIEEFIGLYLNDQYFETPNIILKGVLLSCDATEPGYGIIAEFYKENTVRFILDTEVQCAIFEKYELKDRDYNGLDPVDHADEPEYERILVDLNGDHPRDAGSVYINVDGGFPDPLIAMYKKDILTLEEVCKLRGKILKEKRIYGAERIVPRTIRLNIEQATLHQGETLQLTAIVNEPDGSTRSNDNYNITWRSSDESLATVNEIGLVTSHGSGIVKIYAIVDDIWARCIIDARVNISRIILDPTFRIAIGQEIPMEYTIEPENATNKNLIWTSSDETKLTVDENGILKALDEGTVTLTCKAQEGTAESTSTITIYDAFVPVESVRITNIPSPKVVNLSTNSSTVPNEMYIDVEVLPENATDKEIYARVENPYDDFALYVENITETKFRIKALCYSCEYPNKVIVYSHSDPSKKDTMEVYVDTSLEDIEFSKPLIRLDPEFSESINIQTTVDVNFLPANKGIYPDLIKTGPNKTQVEAALDTIEVFGDGIIRVLDKQDYINNKYTHDTLRISSGEPGAAIISITNPINETVKECKVIVGEAEINSFRLLGVPSDWSLYGPGDRVDIYLDIDPGYWPQFPELYSVNWSIEGDTTNAIEIINNTTYITVVIKAGCENVLVKAVTNNGLAAGFMITIDAENDLLDFHYPNNYKAYSIKAGSTYDNKFKLQAVTEHPGRRPVSTCIWESNNTSVITVDRNGYIAKESQDIEYSFYTNFEVVGTGSAVISATTSIGTASFVVTVFDESAPIYRNDLLNTHQIDIIYSDDPLQYILNMINSGYVEQGRIIYNYLDGRSPVNIVENMYFSDGIITYSTDDSEVATIDNNGRIDIVPIPDVNKFEFYNPDHTPKNSVFLDIYTYIKVELTSGVYYDKCKIHIRGENLSTNPNIDSIYLSAKAISSGSETSNGFKFGDNNEPLQLRIVASPYYIRSTNNSAITFRLGEQNDQPIYDQTESPIIINPGSCGVNDNIVLNWREIDFNSYRDNDFNMKKLNDPAPNPPIGIFETEYNYGSILDSGNIDHDFGNLENGINPPNVPTDYDYRLTRRKLFMYLDATKVSNNLVNYSFKQPSSVNIYNFNYDDEL